MIYLDIRDTAVHLNEGGREGWTGKGGGWRRVREPLRCIVSRRGTSVIIQIHLPSLACGEKRGRRRRMRLGDPIFWQFFPISSKGKRGGGAFRSTCVRAVRVPEEPAFMAAAYVSALRRHRPSRSRNMFLFAKLRRAPLGLTSGPFFATEKVPSTTKGACPSCQECL